MILTIYDGFIQNAPGCISLRREITHSKGAGRVPAPVAVPGGNHFQTPKTAYTTGPSGRTSQGSCFEAAITGSKEYEIGVTIAVPPILSFGFCMEKSDARYNCGHQKTCPTNGNYASSVPSKAWFST
jgi:hypothetical protein